MWKLCPNQPDAHRGLNFSALFKIRNESSSIIHTEIKPVFDELVSQLKDPEPSVSAQALEDLQGMVFDQTLRQLSKCNVKYFFVYQDELMDCSFMVLGNRKVLSFNSKKIKTLQNKILGILQVVNAPAKVAARRKTVKPRPKKQPSTEESSSES